MWLTVAGDPRSKLDPLASDLEHPLPLEHDVDRVVLVRLLTVGLALLIREPSRYGKAEG